MLLNQLKDIATKQQIAIKSIERQLELKATSQNKGMMGPELYNKMAQLFENRETVDGADLFQLAPGFYKVYNPTNAPMPAMEPSLFFVDVSRSIDGDKYIRAMMMYTGQTFHYVIRGSNANPDTPNEWVADMSATVLWAGSVKGLNKTITLADNSGYYSAMIIGYKLSSTRQYAYFEGVMTDTHQLYVPNDFVLNGTNVNTDMVHNTLELARIGIHKDGDTLTITFFKDYGLNFDHMTPSIIADADASYEITTIIGIK